MPKYAAKVDDNQRDLVHVFRVYGWSVQILSAVGQGCPDLLVGKWGFNLVVEIKDGEKVKSARKLTGPQVDWHAGWHGMKCVIESREHIYEIDAWLRGHIEALKKAGIKFPVELGRKG